MELTKEQFLAKHNSEYASFDGDDEAGYEYMTARLDVGEFPSIFDGVETVADLQGLLESEDEDAMSEAHNSVMSYLFGEDGEYQGSFQSEAEVASDSGQYDWLLDWGSFEFDDEEDSAAYTGVRFYRQ